MILGQQVVKERLFNGESATRLENEAYLEYDQLQRSYFAQQGCQQRGNHDDTFTGIVRQLKENKPRADILAELVSTNNEQGNLESVGFYERCIDLSARLTTMLKLGRLQNEVGPREYLTWPGGSLREFVKSHFGADPELSCDRVKFPKSFDAWSLENIAGVKITFTDNLADHLHLVDDDTEVLVFHHASFLERQIGNGDSFFPEGFAEETLRSLSLLFPQSEYGHRQRHRSTRRKQKWLDRAFRAHERAAQCTVDKRLVRCGTLRSDGRHIQKFRFWRDRLIILKETYDDSTPSTPSQWWLDRRNSVQWYTFWVAIVVLLLTSSLGVIQCIEGALQVYKSYHPSNE